MQELYKGGVSNSHYNLVGDMVSENIVQISLGKEGVQT